eukprot:CAMPEP_0198694236 /NCGR_PEP_ID=MMETSP1468-20131203/265482_1 /TAXON_ID=1461545 /ORGANISM="Mantoniella sp, Strain CCMP1436" /LENGTH=98 /DNA_ID=CAMNT_0044449293 /DNA_START=134 /DNA_END=426 /DNA_ORIENTATION=-
MYAFDDHPPLAQTSHPAAYCPPPPQAQLLAAEHETTTALRSRGRAIHCLSSGAGTDSQGQEQGTRKPSRLKCVRDIYGAISGDAASYNTPAGEFFKPR